MPPEDQQETSMRDDFNQAITDIENDEDGAITTETAADAARVADAEGLNDDDGQKAAKAEAEKQVEAEASKAVEKAVSDDSKDGESDERSALPDDGAADESASGTESDSKAPESWNPAAREGWKDLPESVKQQVAKREHEIDMALNDGAAHRKTGAAFQDIADRYAQVIAAEGASDALTGVEELVKTVATLRMGSPQQKVQKIADFISHYGIDVPMLDDLLSGEVSAPGVDPNDPIAAMINERLKPVDNLLARMDEQTRNTNFRNNQNAINEVATFKQSAEFYTDVQNDMADMVELADKRGVKMPLQEAYDKACAINPEVAKILQERANTASLMGDKETLRKKQEAASSISGDQGGEAAPADMTMRETIEAQFDAQTG